MKPTAVLATTLPVLAALFTPAFGKFTFCKVHSSGPSFVDGVTVYADDIPDVPGLCGGLWDNLNGFSICHGVLKPSCGSGDGHDLKWTFDVGFGCDKGMIEATWYEATKNKFGDLQCEYD